MCHKIIIFLSHNNLELTTVYLYLCYRCYFSYNYHQFTLQVLAKGIECDIALLSVENEKFWKGAEPLQFGHLPRLQVNFPAHFLPPPYNKYNINGVYFQDLQKHIGM